MISFSISTTVLINGVNPVGGSETEAGSTQQSIDQTYAAGTNNAQIAVAFSHSTLQAFIFLVDQNATLSTNGTNDVQTISTTGTVTAGTFTLTCLGNTTGAINWNCAASDVQTALQALVSVGSGNVTCTGGPLPATPIVATFVSALAVEPITVMTHTDSLTGGAVSIAHTTTGVVPSQSFSLKAGVPFVWGTSPGYFGNPITADVAKLNFTCVTAARLRGQILNP